MPKIVTSSNTNVIQNVHLHLNHGTAANPSVAFTGSTTTGLYREAVNSVGFAANGSAVGNYSATGAWTFNPTAGLGTGAAPYNLAYGSFVIRNGTNARGVISSNDVFIAGANIYRDGSGALKATSTSTGYAFFEMTRNGTAFDLQISSAAQTADSAITSPTSIGSASLAGAWTFGNTSTDPTHSALGAGFGLTRGGNLGSAATVDFKASDASGTLAQIGGYKNASNAAASGFMMARGTSGTTFYLYVGVNTGIWRTSSSSTDIGLNAGTVVGDQTSDIRLKENIEEVSYGLAEVLQINPISFDMEGRRQIGFSAQQVKDIIPEVVYDTGETIDESGQNKLAMQYANLSAALVNAIKELKAENDALKARIEALEG